MKRFLLLISAMLVMSGMMAQDVYSAGYRTNTSGNHEAVFCQNGSYISGFSSETYNYEGKDILFACNGKLLEAFNRTDNNDNRGYVYNKTDGEYFLSPGADTYIHGLACFPTGGNSSVYAVGTKKIGGVWTAVLWSGTNTDPVQLGNGTYSSYPYAGGCCGYYQGGQWTMSAGIQYVSSSTYHGVVWKYNTQLFDLGESISPRAICLLDNQVYTMANDYSNSSTTLIKVFQGNSLIYTLNTNNGWGGDMWIDGYDIFVAGWEGSYLKVWKNGQEFYTKQIGSATQQSITANTSGIYTCGWASNVGKIWKDNEELYSPNMEHVTALFVMTPACASSDVRTMPYVEGFERGETDWECWTKVDVDNQNGGYISYWDRGGSRYTTAHGGASFAKHKWHSENAQEGWLISPKINISSLYATLKFWTYEGSSGDYEYEGVWVSTTTNSVSSFTTELWTQTGASASWKQVSVDLSEYEGQDIYIGFKYTGTDAHTWCIDDVSVTEVWNQTAVETVPYTENFSSGLPNGWYNLDNDHRGYYWEYMPTEHWMRHTYASSSYGNQDGWLFSPRIQLNAGHSYVLQFETSYDFPEDMPTNGSTVLIALDKGGQPHTSDYSVIWTEASPSSSWRTITVDLTPYAGHTVNIAFRYQGENAHRWFIDNVDVHSTDGINDIASEAIAIYPNPAKDNIHINGIENETEVNIYNVTGALVKTVVTNGAEEINVSELPAGLYMARFGETTLKFTKE